MVTIDAGELAEFIGEKWRIIDSEWGACRSVREMVQQKDLDLNSDLIKFGLTTADLPAGGSTESGGF